MSQEIPKNVQVPVVMAAVLWKALRNNNCPEMDLLASCMINQGLEIEGSSEEVYDYYESYRKRTRLHDVVFSNFSKKCCTL